MYNFFTMSFFGTNLKPKHKATLCLVMLGILVNYRVYAQMGAQYPMVEFLSTGHVNFNMTKIALAFGIFVKMVVIGIFRKF